MKKPLPLTRPEKIMRLDVLIPQKLRGKNVMATIFRGVMLKEETHRYWDRGLISYLDWVSVEIKTKKDCEIIADYLVGYYWNGGGNVIIQMVRNHEYMYWGHDVGKGYFTAKNTRKSAKKGKIAHKKRLSQAEMVSALWESRGLINSYYRDIYEKIKLLLA